MVAAVRASGDLVALGALEVTDGVLGGGTEVAIRAAADREPDVDEALLHHPHSFATRTTSEALQRPREPVEAGAAGALLAPPALGAARFVRPSALRVAGLVRPVTL